MEAELAASLRTLEAELIRLDTMAAALPAEQSKPIAEARAHLAQTIEALTQASVAMQSAAAPTPPRLADRMVMIAPPGRTEAFRTKVKLKAPEPAVTAELVAVAPPPGDDLTRVRGIDRALAGRLAEHGITSFAVIAGWAHGDVRRISEALGLGRQISRQNWIEQAALLSASASSSAPIVPPVVVSPTHDPVAVTAEIIAPPVKAPPAPAPLPPDRLDLISGIDADMASRLRDRGITQFAQIAAWTRADIQLFDAPSITRHGWIEQAALLASGRLSQHAIRTLRGDFASLVTAPAADLLPEPYFTASEVRATAVLPAPEPEPEQQPSALPLIAPMPSAIPEDATTVFDIDAALIAAAQEETVEPGPAPAAPIESAIADTSLAAALNRVLELEQELAAQVANDTVVVSTRLPSTKPAHQPTSLHIEDEEFPELHVGEADVKIVRKAPQNPVKDPRATDATTSRGMRARLRRSSALDDIDKASYAGYRDHVEEANVEIVKPGAVPAVQKPCPEQPPTPAAGSLKRLLSPFKRQT